MANIETTEKQRRLIFSVLFLSILVTMIGVGIIAPFLPIYAQEMGAGGIMIGMIFGGFSMARLVSMPIFGKWSDKKGRKRFIYWGFLIYSIVSILFIFATSKYHLLAIRMLQGFSAAMIIPLAMAYVGDISRVNHEARSMNSINIALFLGFSIGPITGGIIHKLSGGITLNFVFLGISGFIAFLLVIFLLPDLKPPTLKDAEGNDKKDQKVSTYREILKNRSLKGIFLFRLSNALGRGALMAFLPILATSGNLKLDTIEIGIVISSNLLLSSLLQIILAKVADNTDRKMMAIIGNILAAVTLFIMPFTQNFTQLLIANLFMGVSGAISIPAVSGLVIEKGRKYSMGSVMAAFNIAMSIGLAGGPLIGGLINDISNITYVFIFASASSVMGSILIAIFLAKRKNDYDIVCS